MATIVPLFWQLINLYGTAPTVFMIFCGLQMLTVGFAAIMYPLLFFQLSFIKVYYLAVLFMVIAFFSWLLMNISINRRAGFKLIKLQFSTWTAFALLSILLGRRLLSIQVSSQTIFWDLHLKPNLAGQLRNKSRQEIISAICHDYQRAKSLMPDAILFGCSPGSFKNLLKAAGLQESQFLMMKTIIPAEHAKIFGLKRPFYFYVISIREPSELSTKGKI